MSFLSSFLGRKNEGPVSEDDKTELELYIYNTYELHRQHEDIVANLIKKIKRGVYDPSKAPKLWEYWVEEGAKRYWKEIGGGVQPAWHVMFPTNLRRELAQEIAKTEYRKIMDGEYGKF